MERFSDRILLPEIPEGPGLCLIENESGKVLQVAFANNIRRRIGQLLDSQGSTCVHGPKIYAAQEQGEQVYVRWKHTSDYKNEKKKLMEELAPLWAP